MSALIDREGSAFMQTLDMTGVQALVFDLDGTLLNTAQVIASAASDTLRHMGHPPLPQGYIMPNMFGAAADLMVDVLRERGHALPSGGAMQVGAWFEHYYAQKPSDMAPLYDGVPQWLQAAKAQGYRLGVCTNKQYDLAVKGLHAAGVAQWIDVVVGRDTCGISKPHPQPLLHTLQCLDVSPQHSVFFGDTHADAACAQAAGVPFAWFSGGFGTEAVHAYPQALAYSNYAELAAQLLKRVALVAP